MYITALQLKVARNILDLGVRDIAVLLHVSKTTISKVELNKTRDFLLKHNAALVHFFLVIISPFLINLAFNINHKI